MAFISAAMRKAHGYGVVTGPGPGAGEMDTFMCAHCNCHQPVTPGKRPEDTTKGSLCYSCYKLICSRCQKELMRTLRCEPLEKRLDRAEGRKVYDKIFAGAKI